MMANENVLSRKGMALVRRALDAAAVADGLTAPRDGVAAGGFTELYAYATRPDRAPRAELLAALETDDELRRRFEALLRDIAFYRLPQVAAASGAAVSHRAVEGCRISLRESRAEASQVFVIIELDDRTAKPGSLFVCGAGQAVRRVALPEPREGRVQLLLEAGSDIVQGLRDIDTEIFLR